jgi:glutamate dehydrogenase (NAD(P)+)
MENIFEFADELGPAGIVHIYHPRIGLKAVVAIDNVPGGPSIGGIRMALDVVAAAGNVTPMLGLPKIPTPYG